MLADFLELLFEARDELLRDLDLFFLICYGILTMFDFAKLAYSFVGESNKY